MSKFSTISFSDTICPPQEPRGGYPDYAVFKEGTTLEQAMHLLAADEMKLSDISRGNKASLAKAGEEMTKRADDKSVEVMEATIANYKRGTFFVERRANIGHANLEALQQRFLISKG